MLLRSCLEPATPEERRVRQQLKTLLDKAAAQQVESSALRQRSAHDARAAQSVYRQDPPPSRHRCRGEEAGGATVKQRLGPNRDSCDMLEAHRRSTNDDDYNYDYGSNTTTTTTTGTSTSHDSGTTNGALGITIARKIETAAGRWTRRGHAPSVRRCAMRGSPRGSGRQQQSPSTMGDQP
jgi:hypothetical protein